MTTVTETPSDLADGRALVVDDGSGPVKAVIGPAAMAGLSPARTS